MLRNRQPSRSASIWLTPPRVLRPASRIISLNVAALVLLRHVPVAALPAWVSENGPSVRGFRNFRRKRDDAADEHENQDQELRRCDHPEN
jgi:hypothetical protein